MNKSPGGGGVVVWVVVQWWWSLHFSRGSRHIDEMFFNFKWNPQ